MRPQFLAIVSLVFVGCSAIRSSAVSPAIDFEVASKTAGGGRGAVTLPDGSVLITRTVREADGPQVVLSRSADRGSTWTDLAVITRDVPHTDIGDGSLVRLRSGTLLYSFRRNQYAGPFADKLSYSIRVVQSDDAGKTWTPHSTVVQHEPPVTQNVSRGYWTSFLLETADGSLQCYFDDEETPFQNDLPRHQWVTMKTWNAAESKWINPVTVLRQADRSKLSRDGMMSVVELAPGKLLGVAEGVSVERPHHNVLRVARSSDNGKTWDWPAAADGMLYESPRRHFMALAPWVTRLGDGRLACAFVTDEEGATPHISGTPPHKMTLGVKLMLGSADGRRWDAPRLLTGTDARAYLPGLTLLKDGALLVTYLDFADDRYHAVRGVLKQEDPKP